MPPRTPLIRANDPDNDQDEVAFPDDVLSSYFNTTPPDRKDPLSVIVHGQRKAYLIDVFEQAERLRRSPNISAQNIADLLNALLLAGLPQNYLAEVFQTSKTTIARWLRQENPPRPNLRRVIVEHCLRLLDETIRLSKAPDLR